MSIRSTQPLTGSDCEAIIPMYMKKGADFLNDLRGMFAFFIYDKRDDSFFVARDHVGIIPLYIGWGDDGSVWISSEMKVGARATSTVLVLLFACLDYCDSNDGVKLTEKCAAKGRGRFAEMGLFRHSHEHM